MAKLFGRRSSREPAGAVRLLIYSGRPNPEWHLTSAELDDLKRRLDKTIHGETTQAPSPPPGGYQGFLVFLEGDDTQESPSFLVYAHTVIEQPGEKAQPWEDITGIESWLLEEAARRGFDKQLHALGVNYA